MAAGYVTVTLDTPLYAGRPLAFGSGTYQIGDAITRDDLATLSPRRLQQMLTQRRLRLQREAVRRSPDVVFQPTDDARPATAHSATVSRRAARRERKKGR